MKTRLSSIRSIVVGSVALAATVASCGGSHGSCGVQPCGGNVVGNWQAAGACANRALLNKDFLSVIMSYCEGATLGAVTIKPAGTMSFTSDLNYTATLTLDATAAVQVPSSCLGGQSCTTLTILLQAALVGQMGIQSANCTGGESCTCTFTVNSDFENSSGTYATAGTTLNLYATAGTATMGGSEYCVKDTSLHLVTVDTTMPMAVVSSDITLKKQ
jgi:hypothetical protein